MEDQIARFSDSSISKKVTPGLLIAITTVKEDVPAYRAREQANEAKWEQCMMNPYAFKCSACKRETRIGHYVGEVNGQKITNWENFKYCPRCGAKMKDPANALIFGTYKPISLGTVKSKG